MFPAFRTRRSDWVCLERSRCAIQQPQESYGLCRGYVPIDLMSWGKQFAEPADVQSFVVCACRDRCQHMLPGASWVDRQLKCREHGYISGGVLQRFVHLFSASCHPAAREHLPAEFLAIKKPSLRSPEIGTASCHSCLPSHCFQQL